MNGLKVNGMNMDFAVYMNAQNLAAHKRPKEFIAA